MRSLYPPFLVAVVGVVVYHIAQKSIPRGASPLATLVLAYAIASVLCVASLALYSSELSVAQTWRGAGWPVVALGVGIAGVVPSVAASVAVAGEMTSGCAPSNDPPSRSPGGKGFTGIVELGTCSRM